MLHYNNMSFKTWVKKALIEYYEKKESENKEKLFCKKCFFLLTLILKNYIFFLKRHKISVIADCRLAITVQNM